MRKAPIIAVAASVLALSSLRTAAVELQPGLWEVTTTRERGGTVTVRPKGIHCITPDKAKRLRPGLFDESFGNRKSCSSSEWQTTASGARWRVRCLIDNHSVDSTASYQADSPQHYTSELKSSVTIAGTTATSTLRTEARRIGECPP